MKISESVAPIQVLEEQYKDVDRELRERLAKVQAEAQKVNRNLDKLQDISKAILKYVSSCRACFLSRAR